MTARRAAYIRPIQAPGLTRRSLLGAAGAAAAWWALPSARAQSGPSVVVAGAGLAGLTAAYELERRGFRVTVLEARDRVGGRVHTIRFPNGQHAEAGGEFIDTGHSLMRRYVRRFGLTLEDVRQGPDLDAVAYVDGRRTPYDNLYTREVERQLRRWYRELNRLSRRVDPLRPWRAAPALDRHSVLDLMDDLKLSGTARLLVGAEEIRDDYTVRPAQLSLLFQLHFWRLLWNQSDRGAEAYRVRGGNDQLAEAFARRLTVELGAPVTEIAQSRAGVRVVAGGRSFDADHCVLALPLPPLRAVNFDPAPTPRLTEAIQRVQYGRGTKNLLPYERRFWREEGFSGDTFTDLPLGATWDATDRQPGATGILLGYTVGRRRMSPGQAANQVERIYPGSRRLLGEARSVTWEREPYSGGTYTAFAPGQVRRYWPVLRRPHGRLHLAGEHTALYSGYMEGAVRSGKRAANAVTAAASR